MQNEHKLDRKVYEQMAQRMTSPRSVIDSLVKEELEWHSYTAKRIVEGVGNEVYRVDADNGESIILRIHHGEHPGFTHEKWAMEQAALKGVPTPTVIALGTKEYDEKAFSYSIQTFLNGTPLSDLLDNGLAADEIKRYAYLAGETLARIHSVETQGYGHFTTEPGRGPHDSLVEEMEQRKDYEKLCAATAETNLSISELDAIIETIDNIETDEEPHLVHVDYAPKHIFVTGNELTGVIDWEICMSGITATDFNRWRSQDNRIPMMELLTGYETMRKLPDSFWDTFLIVQLHSALRTMLYHHNITQSVVDIQKAAAEAKSLLHKGEPLLN